MSNYWITGVWYTPTGDRHISHALIHSIDPWMQKGKKMTREEIIDLLKKGNIIKTATWNYTHSGWYDGSEIFYDSRGFIKTVADATTRDNLGNLPDFKNFPIN